MADSILKSASWMVLFRMADRILGFVSTIILARLLVPADFGLVAMAMSVIAIIDIINSFGFDIALIQKDEPTADHFNTVWTLQISLSLACGLLIALAAIPVSVFYDDARLNVVMLILAATWVLTGLTNVGIVNFRREMRFQKEFLYLATKRVLGFVVTLTLAFTFRTYWALIAGMVVTRVAGVLLSYMMEPFRPRLSLRKLKELLDFSQWLFVNNIILIGVVRFPHFVIGRVLGAQSLGLYTVGNELGSLAITELAAPVNRAVFPAYSRLSSSLEEFKQSFLQTGSAVLIIALPASFGIALIAEPAVLLLLGDAWSDAIPIVQIAAWAAACIAAATNNGIAYLAMGLPRATAIMAAARLLVLVPLGLWAVQDYGMVGVAWSDLIASAVCLLVSFPLIFKKLKISIREYMRNAWRPIVAVLIMILVVWSADQHLVGADGPLLLAVRLFAAMTLGAVSYTLSLTVAWWLVGKPAGPESYVLTRFREVLRRGR